MGHIYEFGQFRLHETAGKLTRGDDELHLTAKGFATLLYLVERAGSLVPKDELLERIWPDGFVEPANLTQTIYVLRKTLDDADAQIIETVPGRGYRFAPPVQLAAEPDHVTPAPARARRMQPFLRVLWPACAAVIALVLMALRSSAPSAGQSSSVSLEAHRDYVLGRYYWSQRTYPGVVLGMRYFKAALQSSPGYAQAYAGIADSYAIIGYYSAANSAPRARALALARAAAQRAIALDPNLGEAHASLGFSDSLIGENDRETVREFQRSIALDPGYATAREWYSWYLFYHHDSQGALDQMEQARNLDPLSPIINFALANQLFFSRRYEEASEQWHQAISIDPNTEIGFYGAGLADEQLGLFQLAAKEFRHALTLSPKDPDTMGALAYVLARTQQPDGARRLLAKISRMKPVPAYDIALVTDALGQRTEALRWLALAESQHDRNVASYPMDPRMDDLRHAASLGRKAPDSNA
ncbi:MAG: winged helix-turn-helix domain-containing protein [Candidatus Eremiobacteraeota bacterium]|nr:winged helix-turn-helix domain-containing protein [Candidatus Eremiobacteraeota bacterium]